MTTAASFWRLISFRWNKLCYNKLISCVWRIQMFKEQDNVRLSVDVWGDFLDEDKSNFFWTVNRFGGHTSTTHLSLLSCFLVSITSCQAAFFITFTFLYPLHLFDHLWNMEQHVSQIALEWGVFRHWLFFLCWICGFLDFRFCYSWFN